jgi:HEAT repeat protein
MVRSARIAAVTLAVVACAGRPPREEPQQPPVVIVDASIVPTDAAAADAPVDAYVLAPEVRAQLENLYEEHAWEIEPAIDWLVARPVDSRHPLRLIVEALRVEPATGFAMVALGRIGDARDVELLANVLADVRATDTRRWHAADALAVHQSREAERLRAVLALKELGHEKSAGALRRQAEAERSPDVKKALKAMGY